MREPTEFEKEMMLVYVGKIVPVKDFEEYMKELKEFDEQEELTLKSVSPPC